MAAPRFRWHLVLTAAAAGMVFYLDRQSITILKTTLSAVFGMGNYEFAVLISAYMVPYTVCYLVSGRVIDRWGTRRSATVFLVCMAAGTMGCGLARTFPQLVASRGLLGVAESGIAPSIITMLALNFSADRRAFANTLYQAIQALAPVCAPPAIAWLAMRGQWRLAFVLPAAVSALAAILWHAVDKPLAPKRAAEDRPKPMRWSKALAAIWANRPLRAVILARVLSDPFYFFVSNWYVGFLQDHAGWSLAEVGRWAWIPWLVVPLANVAVGLRSDRQAAKTRDPAGARKCAMIWAVVLAPAAALLPFMPRTGPWLLALITCSLIMANIWITLSGVLVSELAISGTIATSLGIMSAFSGVTSVCFNQLAGTLIDRFGYMPLFVGGALLHPTAAWILSRRASSSSIREQGGL